MRRFSSGLRGAAFAALCVGFGAAAAAQSTAEIERAQALLLKAGYDVGVVDGVYGPATRRAVRAFQSDWRIEADGEIGPALFEKLAVSGPVRRPIEYLAACAVEVFDPRPQETVFWSGACEGGKPQGEGVLVRRYVLSGAPVEERYEGAVVDGAPSGRGVRVTARGDRYEGDWLRGQRHGVGAEAYADGAAYDGEWRFDLYDGSGRLETAAGDVYQGGWEGGLRHGVGVESFANGDRYEGAYVYGAREGDGVYSFASGAVYEGSWARGAPEGDGVYRSADGMEAAGAWRGGCLVGADPPVAALAAESCAAGE